MYDIHQHTCTKSNQHFYHAGNLYWPPNVTGHFLSPHNYFRWDMLLLLICQCGCFAKMFPDYPAWMSKWNSWNFVVFPTIFVFLLLKWTLRISFDKYSIGKSVYFEDLSFHMFSLKMHISTKANNSNFLRKQLLLFAFNPLSPHDTLKHHITSLKGYWDDC